MSLNDMRKLFAMASSGEMQAFVANFQAELDALKADRLALKQAFPRGYVHFNARLDAMDARLDTILTALANLTAGQALSATTGEQEHVGKPNGAGSASDPDSV